MNTVRTHTRHIYAKLGVTSRREAVREAGRLGLLVTPESLTTDDQPPEPTRWVNPEDHQPDHQ